jgi:hypothetical protein
MSLLKSILENVEEEEVYIYIYIFCMYIYMAITSGDTTEYIYIYITIEPQATTCETSIRHLRVSKTGRSQSVSAPAGRRRRRRRRGGGGGVGGAVSGQTAVSATQDIVVERRSAASAQTAVWTARSNDRGGGPAGGLGTRDFRFWFAPIGSKPLCIAAGASSVMVGIAAACASQLV